MPAPAPQLSFGIKTTPMNVTYEEIVTIWREADAIPAIEHAWLWDHMLPLFTDVKTPVLDGWTLLPALAAQTERLRLGLLVTSNRTRPPAVLAKMAATTDVLSGGRLDFGVGVGATNLDGPFQEYATREYAAYGLPLVSHKAGRESLAETCDLVKRMWAEDEPFDFDGTYYTLRDAICEPKPVQRPGPPVLIGGWGSQTLRVVAEHADIWNIPGPPHHSIEFLNERSSVLDRHCREIGRYPGDVVRSTQYFASYDDPASTRAVTTELIESGFTHLVISAQTFPGAMGAARWLAEEIIEPVKQQIGALPR